MPRFCKPLGKQIQSKRVLSRKLRTDVPSALSETIPVRKGPLSQQFAGITANPHVEMRTDHQSLDVNRGDIGAL